MSKKSRPKRGRPAHTDDPPKLFSTTIPNSVYEALDRIAKTQRRPKSEILTDAIRAYLRRFDAD